MSITIHVPQPVTHRRLLASYEHPGRPSGSVAGGWIADFVALKRCIMLCPFCVGKFNPRKYNYEVWRNDLYSVARCDDCKQHSRQIRSFIHESNHYDTGEWMSHSPRRGRWATFFTRSGR